MSLEIWLIRNWGYNKPLNFWAIHDGVLPFLNLIFGARFVLLFRQKNQKHLSSAKPVHFLHLNSFHCKNSPFQRPPLRLALQTKQCFVFAASPCASNKSSAFILAQVADDASAYQIKSRI